MNLKKIIAGAAVTVAALTAAPLAASTVATSATLAPVRDVAQAVSAPQADAFWLLKCRPSRTYWEKLWYGSQVCKKVVWVP